jgi:hypothetical protein
MLTSLLSLVLLGAAPKVVSPEWNAVNVKKELAAFYADALAEALRKEGLQVITSQDIATLLGMERQKALVGCAEGTGSCMAELANALGADATLTVNIARFDDGGFRGIAKLLSSQSGQTLSSVTLDAKNERKLLDAISKAAQVLAAGLLKTPVPKQEPVVETPDVEPEKPVVTKPVDTVRPPIAKWWWLFGLGGLAFGGAAGGLFGIAGNEYSKLQTSPTYADADQRRRDGKTAQFTGWAAAIVGGGLLITGIVLAVLPGTPVVPTATVTPTGASVGVGGVF